MNLLMTDAAGKEGYTESQMEILTVADGIIYAYHYANKSITNPNQLTDTPVKYFEYIKNNVMIEVFLWVCYLPSDHASDKKMINCRIKVTPEISVGDNIHYLQATVMTMLNMYSDIVISSDKEGIYFIW